MLKLYNTLTRKKEEFKPLKKGEVGLYACGPTVYWYPHIGNMRSFLFSDLLRRVLEDNGFKVNLIMNITDVGHLTDDSDDGDDKMIIAMQREGKTAFEIADFYTQAFFDDIKKLNIKSAKKFPKATEHINEQIQMIEKIQQNGFSYKTSDGIYFDTSKLSSYGVLSKQKADEKKAGARVDIKEKKNLTDFALWKFSSKDTHRQMEWNSPWGKGFPGWHIECSAMSIKYLGVPFDIHTGGIDHIPVHHENEIAQSIGAFGAQHSKSWMHNEFLTINDGKMSKSSGNLFTIQDLVDKNYNPIAFRYFTFGAHYRTKLNFTWEALSAAQNALHKLQDTVRNWDSPKKGCIEFEHEFKRAINDDLDTPKALAIVWKLVESDFPTYAKAKSLLEFDRVLGFDLDKYVAKPLKVPKTVEDLVKQRENAREIEDWKKSDEFRDKIEELGYCVEDTPNGSKIIEKRN